MTQKIKERLELLKLPTKPKYDGNNIREAGKKYSIAADDWIEIIRYEDGFNEGVDACLPLLEEVVREERDRIISKVESTIAEFEEQGIGVVAAILEESFHGKKEVEY